MGGKSKREETGRGTQDPHKPAWSIVTQQADLALTATHPERKCSFRSLPRHKPSTSVPTCLCSVRVTGHWGSQLAALSSAVGIFPVAPSWSGKHSACIQQALYQYFLSPPQTVQHCHSTPQPQSTAERRQEVQLMRWCGVRQTGFKWQQCSLLVECDLGENHLSSLLSFPPHNKRGSWYWLYRSILRIYQSKLMHI